MEVMLRKRRDCLPSALSDFLTLVTILILIEKLWFLCVPLEDKVIILLSAVFYICFILSVNGHSYCFQFGAFLTNTSMNISIQDFL